MVTPGHYIGADIAELTRYRHEHVDFVFQFHKLIRSLTAEVKLDLVSRDHSQRSDWVR